jgi:hypothetical protein
LLPDIEEPVLSGINASSNPLNIHLKFTLYEGHYFLKTSFSESSRVIKAVKKLSAIIRAN